eukprot:4982203-Pyramimonas_sp.AAC.1
MLSSPFKATYSVSVATHLCWGDLAGAADPCRCPIVCARFTSELSSVLSFASTFVQSFIIARATSRDKEDPAKTKRSYYSAHHLNKSYEVPAGAYVVQGLILLLCPCATSFYDERSLGTRANADTHNNHQGIVHRYQNQQALPPPINPATNTLIVGEVEYFVIEPIRYSSSYSLVWKDSFRVPTWKDYLVVVLGRTLTSPVSA